MTFELDLDSNPHPRMLAGALSARRSVGIGSENHFSLGYWHGYLAAMVDATGCDEADLIAWLDRHEADE